MGIKANENNENIILLCCLPGTGASTAVNMFMKDPDIHVTQYNPTIDIIDNEDDFITGLKSHFDRIKKDPRLNFVLITHKATIRAALDEAGMKYTLLVPHPMSVEFYQRAVLKPNPYKDPDVLSKQQFMATRFVNICAKYNEEISNGIISSGTWTIIGDAFHAEFITDVISKMAEPLITVTPMSPSRMETINYHMSEYLRKEVPGQINWDTCVFTIDSHGRAIIRTADPINDLDCSFVQPNGLFDYAHALTISPLMAAATAYKGVGADFITLSKEDAAAILRILDKIVEDVGDDVTAFGDDGISYERLHDRMSGLLYPIYRIKKDMAGLK